ATLRCRPGRPPQMLGRDGRRGRGRPTWPSGLRRRLTPPGSHGSASCFFERRLRLFLPRPRWCERGRPLLLPCSPPGPSTLAGRHSSAAQPHLGRQLLGGASTLLGARLFLGHTLLPMFSS